MVDRVPTIKTANARMCLLLATGKLGMLTIEDAERLQVRTPGGRPRGLKPKTWVGPS